MIYILTVSNVNPPDEETLKRLERVHTAPNLGVVRKYVDEELPNGFTIKKEDKLLINMVKTDEDLRKSVEISHIKIAAKEKAFLKRQEILAGVDNNEKPYEPGSGNPGAVEKGSVK